MEKALLLFRVSRSSILRVCGSWKGGRTDAKRVLLFFSTTVVLSSSGVALSFGKEQALSTEIKE
jgi:hypothetical protein